MAHKHIILMGVSGSGKTSVAAALAEKLGWSYGEADDFHPRANVDKMAAGHPLNDEDRWPWLETIARWTADHDAAGESTIVTCSALKRIYRDKLREVPGETIFVHLAGPQEVLEQRMATREGHFMPTGLLPSQFDTLEPLDEDENGFEVSVDQPFKAELADVWAGLAEHGIHAEKEA